MSKFPKTLIIAVLMAAGIHSLAIADGYEYEPAGKSFAPPEVFSWTGFHIGANLGGLFSGEADTNTSFGSNDAPIEFNNLSAFAGGVQLGYDLQMQRWVIGIEADFQWLDLEERAAGDLTAAPLDFVDGKLNWFGTVRGRLGYAYDNWMPYITAGLVYGDFEARYALGPWSNETNVGWTIGGGAEFAIDKSWSLRGEYLYLHFPDRDISVPGTINNPYKFDFDAHYARTALNYRF